MFRLCVTAEKVTFSRKVFKPGKDPFKYVDIAALPVIKSMCLERANMAHHLVSIGEKLLLFVFTTDMNFFKYYRNANIFI